jgi:hypothetical protein
MITDTNSKGLAALTYQLLARLPFRVVLALYILGIVSLFVTFVGGIAWLGFFLDATYPNPWISGRVLGVIGAASTFINFPLAALEGYPIFKAKYDAACFAKTDRIYIHIAIVAWRVVLGFALLSAFFYFVYVVGPTAVFAGVFFFFLFLNAVAVIYCWTRDAIYWFQRRG